LGIPPWYYFQINAEALLISCITNVENLIFFFFMRCILQNIRNLSIFWVKIDITQDFCEKELDILQKYLQELPSFRIARVGLRANSKTELLLGFLRF
jgi:hypothetical protein